jgi:signal transduction histidine kinase
MRREWLRTPKNLTAAFLCVVLAPSALLAWSAWRLVQQGLALEAQERQQQQEQSADIAVSLLQQKITSVREQLERTNLAPFPAIHDATTLVVTGTGVVTSGSRLLYYSTTEAGEEAPLEDFTAGERLEFVEQNAVGAARWFHTARAAATPAARAGMLIREARALRRLGDVDAALSRLRELSTLRDTAIAGIPADLMARWSACELLEQWSRTGELREMAAALRRDLLAGRWHLSQAAFEVHAQDTARWLGDQAAPIGPALLTRAAGFERLAAHWKQSARESTDGRGMEWIGNASEPLVVVWHSNTRRVSAMIAGPQYIEEEWLRPVRRVIARQRGQLSLQPPSSTRSATVQARRSAAETGLPFTVAITTAAERPPNRAASVSTWATGVGLLVLIVVGAATLIGRAASRELAVARLQSDFVAAVSHEFRTPLTSIRQITEVLHEDRVPDHRKAFHFEALIRHTDRLVRLVETLLDFGRMEAGRSPYRKEAVAVCAWAQSVVADFNRNVAARAYRVTLAPTAGEHVIMGDREALTNALWNLLDNAVKYSPDHREVHVEVTSADGAVALHVRDRGIGIPAAERGRIFQKFVRGSDARQRNIAGTGIGLAMVAHIATAHGGTIRVASEAGAGSTFTLMLPCLES